MQQLKLKESVDMEGSFARDAHHMKCKNTGFANHIGAEKHPHQPASDCFVAHAAPSRVARTTARPCCHFPSSMSICSTPNPTSYLAGKTATVFADSARVTDCLCLKPRDKQYVVLNPPKHNPNPEPSFRKSAKENGYRHHEVEHIPSQFTKPF